MRNRDHEKIYRCITCYKIMHNDTAMECRSCDESFVRRMMNTKPKFDRSETKKGMYNNERNKKLRQFKLDKINNLGLI